MTKANGNAADRERAREKLLLATLPHVAFDGWSAKAIAAGAGDIGMDEAGMDGIGARRYFPGGPAEMLAFFSAWADARMLDALEQAELSGLKIRERVALAVRSRLEALAPHREAVRRGAGFMALPANGPLGLKCLYRTVDDIWYAIGDRSVDFSFYTKRALLGGVLTSTTLYWLDDKSEDLAASWGFLDRRIEDVMRLHRVTGRLESAASRLPDPFKIARRFAPGR